MTSLLAAGARPSADGAGRRASPSPPARTRIVDGLGFRLSSLLAVALLPLGLVSLVQAAAWRDAARDQRAAVLMGQTLQAAAPEVGLIREAQGAAAALAQTVRPLIADEAACDAAMSHLVGMSPQYSVAVYVPLDGRMTCGSNGAEFDYAGVPLHEGIVADLRPGVHVMARGPISGVSVVVVAHPVLAPGGGYSGYIGLALPHDALQGASEVLPEGAAPPPGDAPDFLTFNSQGEVLSTSRGFGGEAELLPAGLRLETLTSPGGASFSDETADGVERLYAAVPLVPGELYALGTVPARDALRLGPVAIATPYLLAALMWLGSLVIAWLAAERLVTRYMRRLSRAIRSFASGGRVVGDFDATGAPAEIREVSQAFLKMTDTILHDEAELEDTVHQKEVLLREVHHRVKNNLQLIASIMNMQMRRARSPETRALMRGLQDRVMSLATVHKELYQTTGQADVRADELLSDLTRQIVNMASAPGRTFRIDTDFATLRLTPDQAVPLSLLLTEGLTNAIKYAEAEPGEAAPRLSVRFLALEGERARLEILNTARAPAGAPGTEPEGTGLGRQLIAAFASQLGGDVVLTAEPGRFALRVEFAMAPLRGAEHRHDGAGPASG